MLLSIQSRRPDLGSAGEPSDPRVDQKEVAQIAGNKEVGREIGGKTRGEKGKLDEEE